MIVGSVLLVVVAGVLLGVGLVRLDAALLYSSIGVSALAALTLAVGVRRAATLRAGHGTIAIRPVVPAPRPAPPAVDPAVSRPVGRAKVVTVPDGQHHGDRVDGDRVDGDRVDGDHGDGGHGDGGHIDSGYIDSGHGDGNRADAVPVDGGTRVVASARVAVDPAAVEGAPEVVDERELARARRLDATVLVDHRPWFHRTECPFVLGPAKPMPVARAVQLGVTSCGRCRPVTSLLADIDPDTAAGGSGD
jgi:hypothetical protein